MSQPSDSDNDLVLLGTPLSTIETNSVTETDPSNTQSVFQPTSAARVPITPIACRPQRGRPEKRKATQLTLSVSGVMSLSGQLNHSF
jgi:hypothetical protein